MINRPDCRKLSEGQSLRPEEVTASGHETRPPARYTEPSLVAKLEELNIGRPSTYATIIRTITSRDYVFKKGSALVPTWLAFAVTRLLEEHFPRLVDYSFTAQMEEVLDQIADGDAQRLQVLTDFYFGGGDEEGLQRLVSELGDIDARALSTFPIGDLDSAIVARVGRYGTYVEDGEGKRASVDEALPPDELTVELAQELLAKPMGEERELGTDPETGLTVVAKSGRFGPYVTEILAEDAAKIREAADRLVVRLDGSGHGELGPGVDVDEPAPRGRRRRRRGRDHRSERPLRPVPQEGDGFPFADE